MSNPRWMFLAVALSGAGLALPAAAEDACLSDAKRLCSATPAGGGRVYFCLRSNWNQLSEGCQALLDWAKRRANEVTLDCQGDAFAYCQGVPPGQGRVYACLAGHRDQISSECKKGLELVDWFTRACGADRARLCSGIPSGDGGAIACLVTRRDQLSPACQAVFWP
jgi:sugar (pentulose or hexulose) kinase